MCSVFTLYLDPHCISTVSHMSYIQVKEVGVLCVWQYYTVCTELSTVGGIAGTDST